MSVTFRIGGGDGDYGGFSMVGYEMNLANVNAEALLHHLGLIGEEGLADSADPHDVLTALAIREGTEANLVQQATQKRNVYDHGRSIEQVRRYFTQLAKIASKAASMGRRVVWD